MTSEDDEEEKPRSPKPEIIPPTRPNGGESPVFLDIAAQINQYTDRPDLFIDALERHDPGFVKRMNAAAEEGAAEMRRTRFRFGKHQAYLSLGIQSIAAIALLFSVFYLINYGVASFWTIIALAIFYAITQGGRGGFKSIVEAISAQIKKLTKSDS